MAVTVAISARRAVDVRADPDSALTVAASSTIRAVHAPPFVDGNDVLHGPCVILHGLQGQATVAASCDSTTIRARFVHASALVMNDVLHGPCELDDSVRGSLDNALSRRRAQGSVSSGGDPSLAAPPTSSIDRDRFLDELTPASSTDCDRLVDGLQGQATVAGSCDSSMIRGARFIHTSPLAVVNDDARNEARAFRNSARSLDNELSPQRALSDDDASSMIGRQQWR